MKALLLKDWYMVCKYCKSYLIIFVIFLGAALAGNDNLFFAFYPCLITCLIPVNLLSYDERSKWTLYSATLPYTKAQLVSSKYLIGLIAQLTLLLLSGIVQAIRLYRSGTFVLSNYLFILVMILILSAFSSSVSLPFMFKLGVEKGRMAYLVMVGIVCAGSSMASGIYSKITFPESATSAMLPLFLLGSIAMYALSWFLSIRFYSNKELY